MALVSASVYFASLKLDLVWWFGWRTLTGAGSASVGRAVQPELRSDVDVAGVVLVCGVDGTEEV